jgi:hypothetical protein
MATEQGSLPQFDYLRKRASQDINAQNQQQEEALKRRLATTGALNTGAGLKQQNLQADSAMDRRAQAMEGIGFQEQAEKARLDEVQSGRNFAREERIGSQDFSRGERLGSQEFGAGESALGRKFQTSEREGSQQFAAGESKLTRDQQQFQFQSEMTQRNADREQQNKQFAKTFNLNEKQYESKNKIDTAMLGLAQNEADMDMITQAINAGTTILGEDATADGIKSYAQMFQNMVSNLASRRLGGGSGQSASTAQGGYVQPTGYRPEEYER